MVEAARLAMGDNAPAVTLTITVTIAVAVRCSAGGGAGGGAGCKAEAQGLSRLVAQAEAPLVAPPLAAAPRAAVARDRISVARDSISVAGDSISVAGDRISVAGGRGVAQPRELSRAQEGFEERGGEVDVERRLQRDLGVAVGLGLGVGLGVGVGSGSGVWGRVTSKMRPSMMTAQGSSSWASSAERGAAAMWLSASPGSAAWDASGCSLGHK